MCSFPKDERPDVNIPQSIDGKIYFLWNNIRRNREMHVQGKFEDVVESMTFFAFVAITALCLCFTFSVIVYSMAFLRTRQIRIKRPRD